MPCIEGLRLHEQFVEASELNKPLRARLAPGDTEEQRFKIEQQIKFERDCKAEFDNHASKCSECLPLYRAGRIVVCEDARS
jgi:hypothetical protein